MSLRADRAALLTVALEAKSCTRCPLYRNATQTVFGEGATNAPSIMIGEKCADMVRQAAAA